MILPCSITMLLICKKRRRFCFRYSRLYRKGAEVYFRQKANKEEADTGKQHSIRNNRQSRHILPYGYGAAFQKPRDRTG